MSISLPAEPPQIREHEPMERHSSWRAGGVARYYSEPTTVEQARCLAAWAAAAGLPLVWAGRGTNMLVDDAGFPGLIASYRAQAWQIEEQGETALAHIEAGSTMAGMARRLAAMGWAGLEWAEGLPGSVGGAVVGNAGCYGSDIAAVLAYADLLIGDRIERWPVEQLGYGYRTSALKAGGISRQEDKETKRQGDEETLSSINQAFPVSRSLGLPVSLSPGLPVSQPALLVTAACFRLRRGDPAALAARTAAIAAERKRKTPAGSSCGSVFKNPPGDSAGRLIEAVGLKGHAVGAALISPLHANYIINSGGASAADIQALIALAQAEVARQFGIMLELEVRIIL